MGVEVVRRLTGRLAAAAALPVVLWLLTLSASAGLSGNNAAADQDAKDKAPQKAGEPGKDAKSKVGLQQNDPKAYQGYSLMAPMGSTKTYLFDMQGRVVRTWEGAGKPGHTAYLLENGHMLRASEVYGKDQQFVGGGGGSGGRVQEFTWDGEVVWDFIHSTKTQLPHHDVPKLPNGNVLMIVWEKKTTQESSSAGRKNPGNMMADAILEVKPTGKTTGEIVWEWHMWDHLVQDNDKSKQNYGEVAAHPELIDLNFGDGLGVNLAKQKDLDKLKGIGYLGAGPPGKISPDWTHTNCVSYNPELDQLMLSIHNFSELWIIDHSTTKAEAASHKGGKSGKGGDLLYRWGNPRAYRAGTVKDQQLFAQHNTHWIPKGLPGAGHALVFNNGTRRPDGTYSSVDEIELPVDATGKYARTENAAFGPTKALWSYTAPKKTDFFSTFISGAQRLPNGDTLICSGADGTIFEVTPAMETVWKYVNPVKGGPGGGKGGMGGPKGGPGGFDPKKDGADFKKGPPDGFDPKKGPPDGFDPKGGKGQPPFAKGGKGGPGGGGSVFRVYRYGPDYPGLVGRDLTPGKTIEELIKLDEQQKKESKDGKDAKKGG